MDKRRVTPPLPPELWLCIFHHATHVPGTLIPDIYDNASILGPVFFKKYQPAIREALLTKRALVRVCREWWHLAIPILYQSVYVGRVRSLYSLSSTLAHPVEGKDTVMSTRSLGEYTQRLDIAIRDRAKDTDVESLLLERIIGCMPHLAIFSITASYTYSESHLSEKIMDALHSCAASLCVLDWSSTHLESTTSVVVDLLSKCTQLRVLNCPFRLWPRDITEGVIPSTVTTLHSHYLVPTGSDTASLRLSAPSALQELFLEFSPSRTWDSLLRVYGPQLISVQLQLPNVARIEVYSHLQLLARECPNLRRITITLTNLWNIAEHRRLTPPLPITYLGLRFKYAQSFKSSFSALFTFLEHLRPSMPSLRVVQFLNGPNTEYLLKALTKVAVRGLRPFMEPNVPFRIEDQDGVLLTDRLKALGYL